MQTIEVLEKARELISDPERWTQKVQARGPGDLEVDVFSPTATKWCAIGACRKVSGHKDGRLLATANLGDTTRARAHCTVGTYNDKATHAQVLNVFDATIERLRGQS